MKKKNQKITVVAGHRLSDLPATADMAEYIQAVTNSRGEGLRKFLASLSRHEVALLFLKAEQFKLDNPVRPEASPVLFTENAGFEEVAHD